MSQTQAIPTRQPAHTRQVHAAPVLYRHAKREQWGLAAMLWKREGKRAYEFEDGQERVFKESYCHLLRAEPAPEERSVAIERLCRRAAGSTADAEVTFEDQLGLWLQAYPGGFADERWSKEHRAGAKKRLKRHRDAAIVEANERLGRDRLDAMIASGDHGGVLAAWIEVVSGTDLVPPAQVKALRSAAPSEALSVALRTLLHDESDEEDVAFDELALRLQRSGCKASWRLVTVPRALVHPNAHVAVRRPVFAQQAEILGSAIKPASKPASGSYAHCRATAKSVRDMLIARGHMPVDMLDVHDFMWCTLRPAVRSSLAGSSVRMEATKQASQTHVQAASAP